MVEDYRSRRCFIKKEEKWGILVSFVCIYSFVIEQVEENPMYGAGSRDLRLINTHDTFTDILTIILISSTT